MGKKKKTIPGQKKAEGVQMSLADFQKVTPSSINVPKTEDLMPPAWGKMDLGS